MDANDVDETHGNLAVGFAQALVSLSGRTPFPAAEQLESPVRSRLHRPGRPGSAPYSDDNPTSGHDFLPFHSTNVEPTFEPFVSPLPVRSSGYGNGPRPHIGFWASYERVFWSLSKPTEATGGKPRSPMRPLRPGHSISPRRRSRRQSLRLRRIPMGPRWTMTSSRPPAPGAIAGNWATLTLTTKAGWPACWITSARNQHRIVQQPAWSALAIRAMCCTGSATSGRALAGRHRERAPDAISSSSR